MTNISGTMTVADGSTGFGVGAPGKGPEPFPEYCGKLTEFNTFDQNKALPGGCAATPDAAEVKNYGGIYNYQSPHVLFGHFSQVLLDLSDCSDSPYTNEWKQAVQANPGLGQGPSARGGFAVSPSVAAV